MFLRIAKFLDNGKYPKYIVGLDTKNIVSMSFMYDMNTGETTRCVIDTVSTGINPNDGDIANYIEVTDAAQLDQLERLAKQLAENRNYYRAENGALIPFSSVVLVGPNQQKRLTVHLKESKSVSFESQEEEDEFMFLYTNWLDLK